jgi:hypothetical protein
MPSFLPKAPVYPLTPIAAVPEGVQLEESLKWAEAFARRIDPVARIREEVAHLGVLGDDGVLGIT